uniref:Streptomycin-6-phosphate phosphatase n=1 Tax=Streptomyces netropsis TaxID=55404 RepID=Q9S1M4_STRNE|nr:streptomycin-6-phosphate phosphatase [Streptomyces netropsis]
MTAAFPDRRGGGPVHAVRQGKRRVRRWGAVTGVLLTSVTVSSAAPPSGPVSGDFRPSPARNVILLIGDGMGDSEITAARNYAVAAEGRLTMDRLPMTGSSLTSAVDERGHPDYVTDSAAGATAWATGRKTVNGRISRTPDTNEPLPTLLELARREGYATGNVTTAQLTDATPAALTAHVTDRSCKGPADMAACPADTWARGGRGSIAEQTPAGPERGGCSGASLQVSRCSSCRRRTLFERSPHGLCTYDRWATRRN